MGLETPTWVNDFVTSNPVGSDGMSQGDNHIRNMKTALKNTFPNATKALYFPTSVAAKTTTYTVVAADDKKVIPCSASGGAFTINLPANAGIADGFSVTIIKTDSSVNVVTIDGNGSDPINGALTVGLAHQYQAFTVVWCTGLSGWIGLRSDGMSGVDATLSFVSNVLSRAALSGAITAAAGSNVTTQTIDLVVTIGDSVNVITVGTKGFVPIDFTGTITGWTLVADASGSIVLDVWKDTYANFPPTDADRIAGTEKPTLTAQQKNQDLTLTTWTTALGSTDVLGFEVESATTVKQVTLVLRITKTG